MTHIELEDADRPRKPTRRPYEKPVVEFVELHADQVLTIGCKTTSSGISMAVNCSVQTCEQVGS